MGTFCIVLGILIPVLFALVSHAFGCLWFIGENSNILLGSEPFRIDALLQFPAADKLPDYLMIVGVCVLLGLLIGAGPFFCGISHNKLTKRVKRVERMLRRATRG